MKKVLLTLLAALAIPLLAGEAIEGQKGLRVEPVTWNIGANIGKTRLLILGGVVYLDTSATGQTGSWRRIDNTADSCSQPALITSDTTGTTRPVWENRLWQLTRSRDADSSTHVFRIQTRERQFLGPLAGKRPAAWTPWTAKGANNGYADVTIQDSVLVANARTTSKVSQYSLFFVAGTQARFCPDNITGTATTNTDSIFVDSLRVYVR